MKLNEMLREKRMSMYRLSKLSGVPQSTINDLCSGRTSIEKCTAGNLKKLATALGTTMDELMEEDDAVADTFETFKGNECNRLKEEGDFDFIVNTLEGNVIREYFVERQYAKSFYLLAMVDYLSRIHDIPLCEEYDDIRGRKLKEPLYSSSVEMIATASGSSEIKKKAINNAIPEFMRYNIVEGDIRDVV